jgi:hypothetical protein
LAKKIDDGYCNIGMQVMTKWAVIGVTLEGDPININGLNPWEFEWRSVDAAPVELPHPSYPSQLHRMWIYEINGKEKRVRFAAGELSANVWGFYVPRDESVSQQ